MLKLIVNVNFECVGPGLYCYLIGNWEIICNFVSYISKGVVMAILTVNIDNERDLPILKEILKRFGLKYKVEKQVGSAKDDDLLYNRFKETFEEINDWEAGRTNLQSAKEALAEIESELNHGV